MTAERKQIFVTHSNPDVLGDVIDRFENAGWKIVVTFNVESLLHQMGFKSPDAILIGEELVGGAIEQLCRTLRKNVLLDRIPLFMLDEGTGRSIELFEKISGTIDGAVPMRGDTVSAFAERLRHFRAARYDSVSGLPSGPMVLKMIDHLCDDAPFSWTFLFIKVFGVRIYNIHSSYEAGDKMLRAVGDLLTETLAEAGGSTDFAARLGGCHFCVATRAKRVETLVTKIMNQGTRIFRKFYSPFELVKGYITVEDEKAAGNYHMAELMTAGLQVPCHWKGYPAMLFDISRELMKEIEKESAGYKIVALK